PSPRRVSKSPWSTRLSASPLEGRCRLVDMWSLARIHIFVLAAGLMAVGCTRNDGAGPPSNTGSYTVGEPARPGVCEIDLDCPLGFHCYQGACRAIDNDRDNDGYDATVDCDDSNPKV